MSRVLILGAAHHQVPLISAFLDRGITAFTLDNKPENPGHQLSHKSFNADVRDKNKVLKIFEDYQCDYIATSGSDVALKALAYVNDRCGLDGLTERQADILCNKDSFRNYIYKNGLADIPIKYFSAKKEWSTLNNKDLSYPLLVKPVDVSGGKGISIVHSADQVKMAVDNAVTYSFSGNVIIEQYFEKCGLQICGDGYILDGNVQFIGFGNNFFLDDVYAPFAEVFPPIEHQRFSIVQTQLQKILNHVGYKNGPFNLDVIIDKNENILILEVAPRLGGNFLHQAIQQAYGVDLLSTYVDGLIGNNICIEPHVASGYCLNVMLHRKKYTQDLNYSINFGNFNFEKASVDFSKELKFTNNFMSEFFGNVIFLCESDTDVTNLVDFSKNMEIFN